MSDADFKTRLADDIREEIKAHRATLMVFLGRDDFHGVRDMCVEIETKLAEIRVLEALAS